MEDANLLPALIEQYVEEREHRLALDRQAATAKEIENKTKAAIAHILKANSLTVGGGVRYKATLKPILKPVAENWSLLYQHIADTKSFDLLQKRLTDTAVKARWDEKIIIPGVVAFPVDDISITKV